MHINRTKLRVNLAEYDFLKRAVADTSTGCIEQAIQSTVTYARLHDGTCLKDEAAWLKINLEAAPVAAPHLSASTR